MARPKQGYYNAAGEPLPGVTTICGMLAKPALVGWAAKLATEAAWRIGRESGPMPKWMELVYGKRDAAADAGTLAHELFEAHLRHQELPTVPDTDIGRAGQQAFENARHWLDTSGLSVEPYEKPLVSNDYGFGGTPDAVAVHSDQWFLADWKTGGIWLEHLVQMGAYRRLLVEQEEMDIAGVHLVRFSRDHGDFVHHFFAPDALDLGWEVFRYLLVLRPLVAALEKRVK